jgi:hypothetical protein
VKIEEYPRNLEMLARSYIPGFLVEGSKDALIERAKQLSFAIKNKRRKTPAIWRFSVPLEHPVVFKLTKVAGLRLQVDIACDIEGCGDDIRKQSAVLRVWSLDENVSYREQLDAIGLKAILGACGWKRVMLRFHLDRRDPQARKLEPLFHLQAGGTARDEENCWLHKSIDVPRFHHPPMDIILLCEFILVNFFDKESENLRKKPEWRNLVRKSQDIFQQDYFRDCANHIKDTASTLLESLIINNSVPKNTAG